MWGPIIGSLLASLFGLSTGTALVLLFIVLPFVAGAIIVPLVQWRTGGGPPPVRTSDILSTGVPGRAEILSVRPLGSVIDMRPMISFQLRVSTDTAAEPFQLEVVQSFPRAVMRQFRVGETVEVRVTPDLAHGAVVWNDYPAGV